MAYLWRRLTNPQQKSLLQWRRQHSHPWHSPPHATGTGGTYLLSAACLNHAPILKLTEQRMAEFSDLLLDAISPASTAVHAWCVLPNHYHLLATTPNLTATIRALGKLHGKTSFQWNREDRTPGRQVCHGCSDRAIRGDRHFQVTINYVHDNPVRHGHAERWSDWPYSSAREYLDAVTPTEASRLWREFPVLDYGAGWDEPWM